MQKTAYDMRISDWRSDVCSSDLARQLAGQDQRRQIVAQGAPPQARRRQEAHRFGVIPRVAVPPGGAGSISRNFSNNERCRSEEHTSELQSLMRISYAVFCLKTTKTTKHTTEQR